MQTRSVFDLGKSYEFSENILMALNYIQWHGHDISYDYVCLSNLLKLNFVVIDINLIGSHDRTVFTQLWTDLKMSVQVLVTRLFQSRKFETSAIGLTKFQSARDIYSNSYFYGSLNLLSNEDEDSP